MELWRGSKISGSDRLVWWGTGLIVIGVVAWLVLAGPATGTGVDGHRFNAFPEILARLMPGLRETGKIVGMALVCSIFAGILIGLARVSHRVWIKIPASVYVEVVRGVPLLVILFMIYYGLNQYLPPDSKLGPVASAVLGLTICYGAFMGEVVRAGIEAIPREELEAASIEGSAMTVLWYVALPRALRLVLPAGANEMIALLKDSSLVSILAISELTRAGQEYASSKLLFFETYIMVALVYLLLTLGLSGVVRKLEEFWASVE